MATMKDIAKLAGVGLGTVSRVINNQPGVKEKTRLSVEEAIRQLDYTPNEVARGFKTNSSNIVGFMTPTIWHPFFAELTQHIESKLYSHGYKLLLCISETDKNKEIQYLDMLERNRVAGLIVITYHDFYNQMKINFPLVTIERYVSNKIPHVASNNYQGGTMATQALIKGGSKRIAYVGGGSVIETSATKRRDAFIDVAKQANVDYVIIEEILTLGSEQKLARRLFDEYPEVDGVFCSTDMFAHSVIQEAEKHGRNIPGNLQVIGYDGIKYTEYDEIYLSTIRQPLEEIAEASVNNLIKLIAGEEVKQETILPVSYWKGQTSRE